jgi:hypothetical protein
MKNLIRPERWQIVQRNLAAVEYSLATHCWVWKFQVVFETAVDSYWTPYSAALSPDWVLVRIFGSHSWKAVSDNDYELDQHMKGWLKPRKTGHSILILVLCVSFRINLKIHPWKYNSWWEPTRGPPHPVLILYILGTKYVSASHLILALFLSFSHFQPWNICFFLFFFLFPLDWSL